MRSSITFRDSERTPLFRLKLPVNVFGLSLFAGMAAGPSSGDLALQLGSRSEVGPSWRVRFKPNEETPPSLIVKAGVGPWGSVVNGLLSMCAEFDIGKGGVTSFKIRAKPRFGDFSIGHGPIQYRHVSPRTGRMESVSGSGLAHVNRPSSLSLGGARGGGGDGVLTESASYHSNSFTGGTRVASGAMNEDDGQDLVMSAMAVGMMHPNGIMLPNGLANFGDDDVNSSLNAPISPLSPVKAKPSGDARGIGAPSMSGAGKGGRLGSNGLPLQRQAREGEQLGGESTIGRRGSHQKRPFASQTRETWHWGDWFVNVHSQLPLGKWAMANFRWTVRLFPRDESKDENGGTIEPDGTNWLLAPLNRLRRIPSLTLEKLSFESCEDYLPLGGLLIGAGGRPATQATSAFGGKARPTMNGGPALRKGHSGSVVTLNVPLGPSPSDSEKEDVAAASTLMTRGVPSCGEQVQYLWSENAKLRKAMDDLRTDFQRISGSGSGAGARRRASGQDADMMMREESLLRSQAVEKMRGGDGYGSSGGQGGGNGSPGGGGSQNGNGRGGRRDGHGGKDGRNGAGEIGIPLPSDISEELKRAIMNAKAQ